MKELPTGLQVFEKIRTSGAIYVDKTDMIHKIVSSAKMQYFISRPRRFGKTLMCWTLNALFSGKRELFEGLAISKTDWMWESYPVIHLDMSKVITDEKGAGVRRSLVFQMKCVASEHEIELDSEMGAGEMLTKIIIEASKKYGKPVVVIVDEYDKPFLDFFTKPEIAKDVREIMRGCYSQLKGNEQHIRFLFMTGISKFTKAGVFSTLNNLNDLSLDSKFGALLGYTENELTEYFAEHLEAGAERLKISIDELVDRLRRHYNGFCFDGIQKVYCPFSILNFFADYRLLNYWIDSGSPRILAEYMKNRSLTVEQFRNMRVTMDFALSPGEIETAPPESFLYQAGYLTLREGGEESYRLDYPNTEVLDSMSELVYKNMINHKGDFVDLRTPLFHALSEGKSELVIHTLNRLLAGIPYDDYVKSAEQAALYSTVEITTQEWLYRSTILAFLRGCGVLTFGEMHSSQGRSDLLV
ncbi:MAG: AAA family ATPase, partial [Chitinispirillales bacterium]|nr:AAA family ATPase [Chitinispirillales bacterium]